MAATANRAAPAASIRVQPFTVAVDYLREALLPDHPAWNRHPARTEQYVHGDVDDIWCRFNDLRNFNGNLEAFNRPHDSVWYPVTNEIPEIRLVVNDVIANLPPVRLGGVLITRIRPRGEVRPHVDQGWHARYYRDKYAVQIAGNAQQGFHFNDCSFSARPGEVYWFDNGRLHWVTNDSDEDRITMIICTRAESCRGE